MLTLNFLAARERTRDFRRAAQASRAVAQARRRVAHVTLREATASDVFRLRRLAQLDSAEELSGPALVAEVDGRLRAALPLDGGKPISDPFHPGLELIELLRVRAAQL